MQPKDTDSILTSHGTIIKLVIAYTLTGAFVFTVIITCLSLTGLVRFADPGQQQKLFYILIVEVATMAVGSFAGFLNFSPARVQSQILSEADTAKKRLWALTEALSPSVPGDLTKADREQLTQTLRSWYYSDGGGMYLSLTAADLFLKAKDSLTDETKDVNTIRENFSKLRTQLKIDAGVYIADDAKTQIGPRIS